MDDNSSINPLPPGTHLHEFVIRETLGRGGSGIVYAANHEILRETFAIKEFLPHHLACRVEGNRVAALPGKEDIYDRLRHKFLEEGQTLVQLARPYPHPNLVQVTDAFRENETVYLCMRLERGKPLDEILESRGTLGEHELTSLILPLLDGLAHAHACQVWHRDIKPSNIFVREDGTPILIDFGAAHRERADRAVSVIAQYTPSFAAPEQMFGGTQGPWTDIYSMAATWFYAVTGHSPPPRLNPDWRAQCRGYSPGFLNALEAGLQFDPERRPQSVAQWRTLFEEVPGVDVETLVIHARTDMRDSATEVAPVVEPVARQPSRWLSPMAGLAVLALSVLVGFQARDWIAVEDTPPIDPLPEARPESLPRDQENRPINVDQTTAGPVAARQLATQLNVAELECARVELVPAHESGIRLSGYLRDREQLAVLSERLRALAPSVAIDDRDIAFAAPFCGILARMNVVSPAESQYPGMPVIQFNHPDRIYREEDYLVLTVANTGAVGGYLYLDFVDSHQDAVHLFPTAVMPDHFIAPGARMTIGAGDDAECARQPDACFVVSRPHGNNLVMATWSETPLLTRWRMPQAEPVDDYLAVLTAAIGTQSSDRQSRQTVGYSFFTTTH
jgi:serine/threonine protein kinase